MPRAVTEGALRERFTRAAGWRVLHVAPAEFANTVAAPTPAIVACVERPTASPPDEVAGPASDVSAEARRMATARLRAGPYRRR